MKKYKTKFPVARIKKIMQTDEDVGKMSQATPVLISKALELFMQSLIEESCKETRKRMGKRLTPSHLKQCIMHAQSFDFLKEVVADVPDPVGDTDAPPPNSNESGVPPTSRGRGRRPKGASTESTQGTSIFNAASTATSSHDGSSGSSGGGDIHSELSPVSVAGIKREGAEIGPEASNYQLSQQHSTTSLNESDPQYSNTPLSNTRANTMSITSVINVTSNEIPLEKGPTRSRKSRRIGNAD